ncbi:MAG: DUF2341 domain-containing protein [Promethearchaeota archaeon]
MKKIQYALFLMIILVFINSILLFNTPNINRDKSYSNNDKDVKTNDPDWLYLRKIYLNPATPEANYQIRIQLNPIGFDYSKTNPYGTDLRFFDQYNNDLDYWIENWDTGGTSNIWVKIPLGGTSFLFMKYGNPSAISQSNGTKVFMLFDDFDDTDLDTNVWESEDDVYSSISISNSIITLYTNSPGPWASHALLGFHSAYVLHGQDYGYLNYIAGASFTPSEDIWVTGDFRWEEPSFSSYYEDGVLFSNDSDITETSNPVRFLTHSTESGPGNHYGAMISTLDSSLGVQNRALRVKTKIDLSGLSEIMLDWVAVRKWSDPEPICTIKAEQSTKPFSNHPDDILTNTNTIVMIDWILYDVFNPGYYRVLVDGTPGEWYTWLNNTSIDYPVDTSSEGTFNYRIEYNNSFGYFGIDDSVIVTVSIIPTIPYSNHPADIITKVGTTQTIDWILCDDIGSGYYRVLVDGTPGEWYTWLNSTSIDYPVDTSSKGTFNYRIEYNNSVGALGESDLVIVEVQTQSTGISGYNPIYILVSSIGVVIVIWIKKIQLKKNN